MANRVTLAPEYFGSPTIGRPVANGSVYVGEIDLNPKIEANQKQISVLQEDGTEVEVSQPLSLSGGGYPTYGGSPVTILVEGSYSLRVDDKNDAQVYYVPKNAEATGDKTVETIADLRLTSGDYENQGVNVQGYYAVGDGGGGPVYWDANSTETDNNGTIIKVTAVTTGRWKATEQKIVPAERFGVGASQSDSVNDAAILSAMTAHTNVSLTLAGSYSFSNPITFQESWTELHIGHDVWINYSGTDAAILMEGVSNCKLTGYARINCTNNSGSGIIVRPDTSAHAQYNEINFNAIFGNGRGAAPSTNAGIGILFDEIDSTTTYIAYYNKAEGQRIADFDTMVKFAAPTGVTANGANANLVKGIIIDNYWKGFHFEAIENMVSDCWAVGSAGSGSDITYAVYIDNESSGNSVTGFSGEPGPLGSPYFIETGCISNKVWGQFSNFSLAGTNHGQSSDIEIGRELYIGSQQTEDELLEGTSYRIGKVSHNNTKGSIITLKWWSRNATTGYYSSGETQIAAWAQGTADIEYISNINMQSDENYATRTGFVGCIIDTRDIYFVFQVRDRGGADANTRINVEISSTSSAEFQFTGPTVEAGALGFEIIPEIANTIPGPVGVVDTLGNTLQLYTYNAEVADDGVIVLPAATAGFGTAYSSDGERLDFAVQANDTVTSSAGTTNTAITDSDGDLCVFDSGGDARVRNRRGVALDVKISYWY